MKKLNITFCSFPDYSGNARSLYEYMVMRYKNKMNYVWVVNDESSLTAMKEKNIKAYLLGSKEFKKYIKTTDVFFTTHCNLTGDKTNKSIYVDLWHGVGPKKLGFTVNNISKSDFDWYTELSAMVDYMITPSEFWSLIFTNRFNLNYKQVLPIGFPKIRFIKNTNAKANLAKVIGNSLDKYDKIIYYMPTFRKGCGRDGDSEFTDNILNLNKYDDNELEKYLKEHNYLLCIKKHPSEESEFLKGFSNSDNIRLIEEKELTLNNFDVYSILDAADLLITDYSSLGIEFLYLDKPVIYLNTDVDTYMKQRGIYFDNYDFWSSFQAVNTLDNLFSKFDEYLVKGNMPSEFKLKKDLWFSSLSEDGGCENICQHFFTNNGLLRKNIKPYVNSNRKVDVLNKVIDKKNSKIDYLTRLSNEQRAELDRIYNSRGWKALVKLRNVRDRFRK